VQENNGEAEVVLA